MDEELRKLERLAKAGDPEAARRLEWLEAQLDPQPAAGMKQAELHSSVHALDDFNEGDPVACYVRNGNVGEYVTVWQFLPTEHLDGVFLGFGLIDQVISGTNVIVAPLKEMDSFYPYFPGTNEPKRCPGVPGVIHRCDRPITRLTQHYADMVCNFCYYAAQKRDDESFAAETEMIENFHNPPIDYD